MEIIHPGKLVIEEALNMPTDIKAQNIRILFAPTQINAQNLFEVGAIYGLIKDYQYESVVIVESFKGNLVKKLAMSSHEFYSTEFGDVKVNDKLRDEFCDEEDDFFISDHGYSERMSLFHQLKMLQVALQDFDVLSLQIGDYEPAIVRELAYVLAELLSTRNVLTIFCCDLPTGNTKELDFLREMIEKNNESGLMHYMSSSDKGINGARAFMAGIMVARDWELTVELLEWDSGHSICGYGAHAILN